MKSQLYRCTDLSRDRWIWRSIFAGLRLRNPPNLGRATSPSKKGLFFPFPRDPETKRFEEEGGKSDFRLMDSANMFFSRLSMVPPITESTLLPLPRDPPTPTARGENIYFIFHPSPFAPKSFCPEKIPLFWLGTHCVTFSCLGRDWGGWQALIAGEQQRSLIVLDCLLLAPTTTIITHTTPLAGCNQIQVKYGVVRFDKVHISW